ncbi:Helix-turn-helix [Butyrivibrio fibrisolvens 16/4]|nr:Helix-turn-helix [Butyrivibrio fibrisolvens 16/4]
MTQKEFSALTGISESTISDWKHKKFNPGADKIPAICRVLNISSSELFELDETEKGEGKYRYYLSEEESQVVELFRAADKENKNIYCPMLSFC